MEEIVSTIHAILAVTLATLSVQDWKCPICPVASKSSPQQMQALAVSLSYLIYDLVCCLLFEERVSWDNTIHHLVSIVGVIAGLSYQKCGSEMMGAAWVTEMSSPFLHLREILKELGYRDTPLNLAADILFASIFTFARMMIGPCITYVTLTSNNPFLIKAMGLSLQLVCAFWIVSTIHAILAVTLATLSVQDWKCPICPVASKSSDQQMEVLAVSLSYLIYDLVCCLFDERINLDNTIHHLVSIVGLMATLSYQKSGSELVGALWVSELSSPFLHLRELLKELGYKDTPLNLTADILFASIFTFARMMIGPYITYVTLTSNNPFLIKTMALGLLLVSAFWFFKIVRMMKYKLTKKKSSISKYGIKHTNNIKEKDR
ncbi:TRAM, LAG1 and CLN8 (TLC) lipid-sensing domain containing protein [Trifolium repens]|nr:TRAM, LAG1 and CLN8 (TLC) lipid-sensing domain containing protein [Trifolium repens]